MWAMGWLLLRGAAYFRKVDGPRGLELFPMTPIACVPRIDERGELVYRVTSAKGGVEDLPQDQVLRIMGMAMDPLDPLSVISLARRTFHGAVQLREYATRQWENDARPGGVISHPGQLTKEARAKIREAWENIHRGPANRGRVAVLEEGMKWETVGVTAADAEFMAAQKASVPDICRWFRVPPHMVAELDRATFSNIEAQQIDFVQHTLRPWLVQWEQSISRDLFGDDDRYFCEFSVEGLLRGDSESRAKFYTAALNGWMTTNEVRQLENLPPVEGGDHVRVPMNTVRVDQPDQPVDVVRKNIEPSSPAKEPPSPRRGVPVPARPDRVPSRRRAEMDRAREIQHAAARRVAVADIRQFGRAMRMDPTAEAMEAYFTEAADRMAAERVRVLFVPLEEAQRLAEAAEQAYRVIAERVGVELVGGWILGNEGSVADAAADQAMQLMHAGEEDEPAGEGPDSGEETDDE